MFDWDDLKVFLAAFREGSIGRAAEALGISGSTASRRLSALEEAIGQTLFVRSPEGLLPTEAGRQAHEAAEAAERSATRIEALVGVTDHPRGTVRVSVSSELLHAVIIPNWPDFTARFPDICLEFVEGTRLADLERWEADIAIRAVRPQSGDNLVVTKLRQSQIGLFAARRLLQARGLDPNDEPALVRESGRRWSDWPWVDWTPDRAHLGLSKLRQQLYPQGRVVFRGSNLETLRMAASAGVGLLLLPGYFGLVSPTLVELPAELPGPQSVYLVSHAAIRHTARVNAAWTYLLEMLRGDDETDAQRGRDAVAAAYGVSFG